MDGFFGKRGLIRSAQNRDEEHPAAWRYGLLGEGDTAERMAGADETTESVGVNSAAGGREKWIMGPASRSVVRVFRRSPRLRALYV